MTNGFGNNRARLHFPNRLKAALQAADWRQQDLVRKTGISATAISNYIHGRALPAADQFARIANELKHVASLQWLGCETDVNLVDSPGQHAQVVKSLEATVYQQENTPALLIPGVGRVESMPPIPTTHIMHDEFRIATKVIGTDPAWLNISLTYKPNRYPSSQDKKALGNRLEERCTYLINKHGLSVKMIEALCFYARLSKVGLTNIIKGLVYPRDNTLFAICAAIGVHPHWLEYGDRGSVPDMSKFTLDEVVETARIEVALAHIIDVDNVRKVDLPDDAHLWVGDDGEFNLDLKPGEEGPLFSDILRAQGIGRHRLPKTES